MKLNLKKNDNLNTDWFTVEIRVILLTINSLTCCIIFVFQVLVCSNCVWLFSEYLPCIFCHVFCKSCYCIVFKVCLTYEHRFETFAYFAWKDFD